MSKQIDTQYIIDLFTGGMSTRNISKDTGYSKTTIIKHLKESGKYEDRSVTYDTNEIVNRYLNEKESVKTISLEMGLCYNSVMNHLHKSKIKIRDNSIIPKEDMSKLIEEYQSGLLLGDLAVMYGCSAETISRTLKSNAVPLVNHKLIGVLNEEEVIIKYNETKSLIETASCFGTTQQTIKNILMKNGFSNNFRKNKWDDKNTEEAISLYKSGISLGEIGKLFNTTHTTIGRKLRKSGVLIRENKKEAKRSTGYKDFSGSHWARIKAGSRNRGLEFSILIEDSYNLFLAQEKKCKLSGVDITLYPLHCNQSDSTASLDRIDSSKGYVDGNIQWVHKCVNTMKQDMSDQEFIGWCKKISYHNSTPIIL